MRNYLPGEVIAAPVGAWFTAWLTSYERYLTAANIKDQTVKRSLGQLTSLGHYLAWRHSSKLSDITQAVLEDFMILARNCAYSPFTIEHMFGIYKAFFGWLVAEGEIERSPMERMRRPKTPESGRDVVTDEHIIALLAVCAGNDFRARRDAAIIRLFLDTGMRLSELLHIKVAQVQMTREYNSIRVLGKGDRYREVPFGKKTALAIDRYLRKRAESPHAHLEDLWLSRFGAFSYRGIQDMIEKRAKQAGIPGAVFPHLFRHTFAHLWLDDDGQEGDLRSIGGWRSDVMRRYGKKLAAKRAMDAHKKHSPGDKF